MIGDKACKLCKVVLVMLSPISYTVLVMSSPISGKVKNNILLILFAVFTAAIQRVNP